MRDVKILGTGCAKCKQTEAIVRDVIAQQQLDASVEKIEDMEQIMTYDVMGTPALVVDGKVVLTGRVPSAAEVATFLGT
jgi:small redox-active disulfide protein 2